MPRRSVAVLVAVVLAVMASAAAYDALHTAQQKAYKNATITSVYILKGVVPQNESGGAAEAQGLIKPTRMPLQFVPPGAVTDLAAIRDRVAGANLPTGEILVSGMFVSLKSISSVAAERVPKGDVAVSVATDQVHSVAGLIQPGDKVDILVDIRGAQETFLYQSVPVLAVGTTLVPAPGSTSTAGHPTTVSQAGNVITFAVTRDAAARIALANNGGGGVTGGIYLALEAAGSGTMTTPTITGANLVPGGPSVSTSTISGSGPVPSGTTSGGIIEKGTSNALAP